MAFAIGILGVFVGTPPTWGQAHAPLQYHGGPVLRSFKIYPLYYGNWSSADMTAQQKYLEGLAGYISGKDKPANQQPMMWQYGVNSATVAPAATASPTATATKLTDADVRNIIHTNQTNGTLPAYDNNTLIVVFLAHGFSLNITGGCAYHGSESVSAFYAVVPQDCGPTMPLVTGHEVFEAAANPDISGVNAWDEAVDDCSTVINLPFGQIPGAADNTQNGTCSTTGYTSTKEIQVYGWSYAKYRQKYDQLWSQGWRLYSLQSYVSNGQVLYNAVWRPGNSPEIQVYGWSYANYRQKYDQLWSQGWRIYILQTYVSNGQVLYNAVWRPGNSPEIQVYGWSYANYRQKYDQLWSQGWRIYILQTYVSNGQVLYNAVWRPSQSAEIQMYGASYTQYRQKYDQLWSQGWRLYTLQTYVSSGQALYNAVWRPGNSSEIQVYGWSYANYRQKYDQLWSQGWRLYILDSYVFNGQVLYNAVWRIGTSNRPL